VICVVREKRAEIPGLFFQIIRLHFVLDFDDGHGIGGIALPSCAERKNYYPYG
jgi:hypothetical protein